METDHGIILKYHPNRLSEGDLNFLAMLIERPKVVRSAPAFVAWLGGWLDAETERREANQLAAVPVEATQPTFNGARWGDSDIASALQVSRILFELSDERPACKEFTRQIHRVTCAWASVRLRDQDRR